MRLAGAISEGVMTRTFLSVVSQNAQQIKGILSFFIYCFDSSDICSRPVLFGSRTQTAGGGVLKSSLSTGRWRQGAPAFEAAETLHAAVTKPPHRPGLASKAQSSCLDSESHFDLHSHAPDCAFCSRFLYPLEVIKTAVILLVCRVLAVRGSRFCHLYVFRESHTKS